MFSSNQLKQSTIQSNRNEITIDPLTLWLIRVSCVLIIVILSGLLLGIPLTIALGKSFFNETVLNTKEILRNLVETSLA